MNKPALKKFATEARLELREKIKIKALQLGMTEDSIKKESVKSSDAVFVDGKQLTIEEQKQRNILIDEINKKGYNQVIEEVAYTWFNRLTALRYMEVNNYLPTKVRVLSSSIEGSFEPDIIKEAPSIDLDLDKDYVFSLKMSNDNDAIDKLYKYLIIKQCNALNSILPFMFEKIKDYTELLFPDGLLNEGSFIRVMTDANFIPEDDWKEIEIIGWLYQYYIAERKDEVFEGLKKNRKITKDDIAPATQLFTPHWIVRYMVENSVGKLWQEGHPNEELKINWKYYIEEAEQEPEVQQKLEIIREESKKIKAEDIKIIDPAMGSGHILVYAFDLLYDIYLSEGYIAHDIPKLIIEKNLYGLDIDKRAFQLAYFALMMKGRSRSRRFFSQDVQVNLCYIKQSNEFPREAIKYFTNSKSLEIQKQVLQNDLEYLVDVFYDATEYGSIIKVNKVNFDALERRLKEIREEAPEDMFELRYREKILAIIPDLVKQGKIMSDKYDVYITNPPYMGSKGMNSKLTEYVATEYTITKTDLFAVFMELDEQLVKTNGYMAMINQHSWMFLKSFEDYRKFLIESRVLDTMLHLGTRAFEEIGGEVVQSTSFITRKTKLVNYQGVFIRLLSFSTALQKEESAKYIISNDCSINKYYRKLYDFKKIPGNPIAYWASKNVLNLFENEQLTSKLEIKKGMDTGNNDYYLRFWHEVDYDKVGIGLSDGEEVVKFNYKWVPYNKGGTVRKWYGNKEYLINWEKNGFELRHSSANLRSKHLYFKESITWNAISTGSFSARLSNYGAIFDSAGSSMFPSRGVYNYLAYMNSSVVHYLLNIINPTFNYGAGSVGKLPYLEIADNKYIECLAKDNTIISKNDWDSFETSWDFKIHNLMKGRESSKLEQTYNNWKQLTISNFRQLKANEEELNRIFIDIYSLQDELTPVVEDKDITITKIVDEKSDEDKKNPYIIDKNEVIKSFISYALGCIFGRYSLDQEGLVFAGGEFDSTKYKTFTIDEDNIITILNDSYFEDDIVSRIVEFVKVTFGEEKLHENLKFVADSLGVKGNETPRETIRRYMLTEFYKDHLKTYKNRPIYWMFTSGKQKAFNVLIYMHRYDSSTLARIRTDYLHVFQSRLEGEMNSLIDNISRSESVKERKQFEKELALLEKKIKELKDYDEILHHMADMKIDIDLDDGVKVNYEKFKDLLEKI